jgi:cyclase
VTHPAPARAIALAVALLVGGACNGRSDAQTTVLPTTRLAADTYLIQAPTGNMVVGVGKDGAIVVGVQSTASTPRVKATVAALNPAPIRFVVATSGPESKDGGAGWEDLGVPVVMHEALVGAGRKFNAPLPRIGFSEVTQLRANDDFVHVVHQPSGYSNGDVTAHFERANVMYFGNGFTSDGYPSLDSARGASLAGLIETADKFLQFPPTMQIVPGRGPVSNVTGLREYRDMLSAVRARVAALAAAGGGEAAVVAAHPTAAFDARWGHGPVSGDQFAAAAFHSLGGR